MQNYRNKYDYNVNAWALEGFKIKDALKTQMKNDEEVKKQKK